MSIVLSFVAILASGEFKSAISAPNGIQIRRFSLTLPEDQTQLLEALQEGGAQVDFRSDETPTLLLILVQWAPLLLIIGFFVWTARRAQRQMNGAFWLRTDTSPRIQH